MSRGPDYVENNISRTGVLFDRVPAAGVIVQGLDVNQLMQQEYVTEDKVTGYQREVGIVRAFFYRPGDRDDHGWEYSEYMILDKKDRPISVSKNEHGLSITRSFEYDAQGRLTLSSESIDFTWRTTEVYTYISDKPDESGNFLYSSEQSEQSFLK